MSIHLFIGLLGWALGVVVGLAGTYLAVQSARGPRERRFMVQAAVGCWSLVALYPAGVWWAAERWPAVWVVQAVVLLGGVHWWSWRQRQLRCLESEQQFPVQNADPIRRGTSVD